jgi:hypothetical protein
MTGESQCYIFLCSITSYYRTVAVTKVFF